MPTSVFTFSCGRILTLVGCLSGLTALFSACATSAEAPEPALQIAFMPDVHFHDIYADFKEKAFTGIPNKQSGKNATIRSLKAELNSTRLFNENYFALLAALDDIVARNIKLVALPGDFSDDGQAVHLRGLVRILQDYQQRYDLRFFATPGNHDPVRPFTIPGGKADFLAADGHEVGLYSPGSPPCLQQASSPEQAGPTVICTTDIAHLGYQEVLEHMADFGFYPQRQDIYWETPYSLYPSHLYSYATAVRQSGFANRQYEVCQQGTGGKYKQTGYTQCSQVPDASYLVEPIPGLWLLAIDANVYLPQVTDQPGQHYAGSGNAGYNALLTHKTQVFDWIKTVVKRAKTQGKQLIAFSHFPMADYYDGQSTAIADLYGKDNFQLSRRPDDEVSLLLADSGLTIHVAGHMHFNDTAMIKGKHSSLFNIQAPSLAAYVPAYKILTLQAEGKVEVSTIRLDKVPRFDELFEHYQQEYARYLRDGKPEPWNPAILKSNSYLELTQWHIRELTRLRFLPREWPEALKQSLLSMSGKDLLVLSQLHGDLQFDLSDLAAMTDSPAWHKASLTIEQQAELAGIDLQAFEQWQGFELAVDFYKLRNAGSLALHDIDGARLAQYRWLAQLFTKTKPADSSVQIKALQGQLQQMLTILQGLQQGIADEDFLLDTQRGSIQALSNDD